MELKYDVALMLLADSKPSDTNRYKNTDNGLLAGLTDRCSACNDYRYRVRPWNKKGKGMVLDTAPLTGAQ